ncbi:MAG TPA: aminotransferase class V-fold PLP-dependent enzyme [Candidatus Baltobacteraceae bacterium]
MSSTAPLDRAEFALDPGLIYLNHAASGVLPVRTRDALLEGVRRHAASGVLAMAALEAEIPATRESVARLIGATAADIAFIRNTSDGANILARGLDWRAGDEIIISDNEFGANAYPWLALREYGVIIRLIATTHERMTPEVLAREINARTRVVAVSWVSFSDGYRHDLAALAAIAHAHGALFFVDAIQAMGAFPIDVRALGIDALFSGGHKWLLALTGLGFLYVEPTLRDALAVRWPGWRSVANIWDFLAYEQPLAPTAERYENGGQSLLGILALRNSINVLLQAGVAQIARHIIALTDHLVAGLRDTGAEIDSLRGANISSGIVTFHLPDRDPVELGRRLQREAKIVTTYRPSGIRISPHGYNTMEEIDAVIAALRAAVAF